MTNDFYKRDDDREWRERTNERLVTLTTAQTVQNDRIDEAEGKLEELDLVLRGDVQKDTNGLLQRIHMIENSVAMLNATIFRDATGRGGLKQIVEDLKENREDLRINLSNRWKFWTAIGVAAISSGFLTKMWPDIRQYFVDDDKTALEHLREEQTPPPKITTHHKHQVTRATTPKEIE